MKWRWPTIWSGERGGWWRVLVTLVLLQAGLRLGGVLSSLLVPESSRGTFNPINPATMKQAVQSFALLLPNLLALASLLAGIRFVHRKPVACVFTDGRPFKVGLAFQSAAVWTLLTLVVTVVLPHGWQVLARRASEVSAAWWPVLALSVCATTVATSAVEEVLFRGYLQPRLGAWVRIRWVAVVIPAALFTLTHRGSSWPAYGGLAFAAVLWGTAAMRAGTLAPLIAMHATNNALNALCYPNGSNAGVAWVGAMILVGKLVIWFGWLLWATRRGPAEALAQPDGAANRSQPVGQETNRTSPAPGSGG